MISSTASRSAPRGLAAAAAAPHLSGAEALAASRGHEPRPLPPGYFPPTVTGLKGTPDHVVEDIMRIDGPPNQRDVHSTKGGPGIHVRHVRDSDETYDCVIVGAGASGLAAAKYYRDRFGESSKILLLDPLPDFGGHSHRNEFHVGPTTFLKNGGTVNLDSTATWNKQTGGLIDIPGSYGQPAVDMLDYLGVEPETFPEGGSAGLGLRTMLLFPAKDWGKDYVVPNRLGPEDWATWLKTTPWSPEAQAAIVRIQTEATDWIVKKHGPKSIEEKKAILSRLTQKRFYMDYIGAPEKAILQYQRSGHGLLGAGAQVVSAGDMWALGHPGFSGMGLDNEPFPGIGRTPQFGLLENEEESPSPTSPDGGASLQLLVDRLIPPAPSPTPSRRTDDRRTSSTPSPTTRSSTVRQPRAQIRLDSLVFRRRAGGPAAATRLAAPQRHRLPDRRRAVRPSRARQARRDGVLESA